MGVAPRSRPSIAADGRLRGRTRVSALGQRAMAIPMTKPAEHDDDDHGDEEAAVAAAPRARPGPGPGSFPPAMYGGVEALGSGAHGPRGVVGIGSGGSGGGSAVCGLGHGAMMPPVAGGRIGSRDAIDRRGRRHASAEGIASGIGDLAGDGVDAGRARAAAASRG